MRKQFFACSLLSLLSICVFAQVKPKVISKPVVSKPKPPVNVFKNSLDTFYYALGVNIAFNLKDQGVEKLNYDLLKKGMDAVFQTKPIAITEQEANMSIQKKLQEFMAKKINTEKEKGRAFLSANAKRNGVISLPSGLQYEVLKKGDSASVVPSLPDTVVANYAGTLIDGTEFDNSYKRGKPLTIGVGNVIPGWTEILQKMHIGDKWRVYIPSELGYQDRGSGMIPGGAALIFEMELLGVKPAAVAQPLPPVIDNAKSKVDEVVLPPVEENKKP